MAAITLVGYLIPAGARIVAPHDCYGGTYRLFDAWHRRGERKHAASHPRPCLAQQPKAVEHQRQQHEIGLAEIVHVEDEGDGDEARQREQPRTGRPSRPRLPA